MTKVLSKSFKPFTICRNKTIFGFLPGCFFIVFKMLFLVHIFDPKYVFNVNLAKHKVSSLDARAKIWIKHSYKEYISGKWVVKNR